MLGHRYEQFLALGLDPLDAVELAASPVELAAVRELIDRGCPPTLACKIVG